jgi:hypothetical protein
MTRIMMMIAITPMIMDTWMIVAISIPKILSPPWLLSGLDDLVS